MCFCKRPKSKGVNKPIVNNADNNADDMYGNDEAEMFAMLWEETNKNIKSLNKW